MQTHQPIAVDRPVELNHYLSTNDVLPRSGLPTLDGYLDQLNNSMEGLENEMRKLRAILDAMEEEHRCFKLEHEICTSIKHPIRSIPPEILGQIFAFHTKNPASNRFADVARLRAVCRSWREVALTTPGLWTSLTIDIHKWCKAHAIGEMDLLKEELLPWLAILDRSHPYHLILTATITLDEQDPKPAHQEQLVHHLLGAEPKPGSITIDSAMALFSTQSFKSTCPSTTEVEITTRASYEVQEVWKLEERLFPTLVSLKICGPISFCRSPVAPSSLQTLQLQDASGGNLDLRRLLTGLPALRELNLSSSGLDNVVLNSLPLYTHHSLEILILNYEGLLYSLSGFSFPCLRLFGVSGDELQDFEETLFENVRQILARPFPNLPLLVSLRGCFIQEFLTEFIRSLPNGTHLYFDVSMITADNDEDDTDYSTDDEETSDERATIPIQWDNLQAIYCGPNTFSLWWIPTHDPGENTHPLTLYVPKGFGTLTVARRRTAELGKHGIEVQAITRNAHKAKLRSIAPHMSKYSRTWWKF
ncbi:hypothetical protein BKA70DRAFT_1206311 [Coprinopsis sp. MPI-PUGE-AT-0042]|nr:hypothetical protein BKA70DRAFT_1206311 [Coprinopsis sp. MPI-PUGE-AT-0042]